MNVVRSIFTREPVLVTGLAEAVVVFAVAFGANLTVEQTGAILALVAILTAIIARAFVSPVAGAE